MFKNYVTIAWRNLTKNKLYSVINILGLAAGMAVAMLIAFWIWDEVTFDHYHAHHGQLAQVMTTWVETNGEIEGTGDAVAMPVAQELRSKYGSNFTNVSLASWNFEHSLGAGETKVSGSGMWVEPNFPSMFSLHMKEGSPDALKDPSSILINASIAKSLFGTTDAINKTIRLDNKNDFKVAGVFEDLPHNTTLSEAHLFLPWAKYVSTENWLKDAQTQWGNHSFQCFTEITPSGNFDNIINKIKGAPMAHLDAAASGKQELMLHPMDKWRLYSDIKGGKEVGGRIQFVWLFGIIGVFVLLLACINFMNLSTARSEKRAKEVGIRKTVGSLRGQLIGQFLSESVLVALVSFLLSLLLVVLSLPLFNSLADKNINLPWSNPVFWSLTIIFTLLTGLVSGSYPALYLSKFQPITVLKGTFRMGRYASLPRKALVVVQFTFSIALIIGTVMVFEQIQFAKNRPINYSKDGLITVPMNTPDLYGHYDAIRTDLLATGIVLNMAESSSPTTDVRANRIGFNWEDKDPSTLPTFGTVWTTTDFGKTIGWKLMEGRDFSKDFATDSLAMILNESAVKQIGLKKDILNQNIQFDGRNYHVIGVIKDMIMESPYQPVQPTVFMCDQYNVSLITVAFRQGVPVGDALAKVETVFKKYNPDAPFIYKFNDEEYATKFDDEQRVGKLAAFFTLLAIFISCLGLFGLTSFVAEQRKKEIGVRKVLGASTFNLWQMLSREFALLVAISCLISIPLAWYYLNGWLNNYNYRTDISVWVFVLSCVGALMITLLTVSFQSIKAAIANPVKSLRTE